MGLAGLPVYKASSSSSSTAHSRTQLSILWILRNMTLFFVAALLAQASPLLAFDMGQSTRCVAIPNQMRVCKDVGYSEMRLPNFLGHSSLEGEVVPRSEDWRPLLQAGCHPQAQAFLCSLIAPVCLDT